jgi:hypothetical protein
MKTLLLIGAIALSINVFGQSSVKIRNLEVMSEDLPKSMKWEDAKKACADLGNGWRLPTKDELKMMYKNSDKIGGFHIYIYYWSSTESDYGHPWVMDFYDGNLYGSVKLDYGLVRAVRKL